MSPPGPTLLIRYTAFLLLRYFFPFFFSTAHSLYASPHSSTAATEHHQLGVAKQARLPAVRRWAGGRDLRLRAWHHPDVLHPLLRDLRLLHGVEAVQDESLLSHHGEWCRSALLCPVLQFTGLYCSSNQKASLTDNLEPSQNHMTFSPSDDAAASLAYI